MSHIHKQRAGEGNRLKIGEIVKKGILGVCIAILSAVILCAAVAVLIRQEMIPEGAAHVTAMIIGALAVFLSAWPVVKTIPQSRLPVAMAMGAGYVLILVLLKLALFPNATPISGWSFAVPLLASAVAGIAGSKKQKRRR